MESNLWLTGDVVGAGVKLRSGALPETTIGFSGSGTHNSLWGKHIYLTTKPRLRVEHHRIMENWNRKSTVSIPKRIVFAYFEIMSIAGQLRDTLFHFVRTRNSAMGWVAGDTCLLVYTRSLVCKLIATGSTAHGLYGCHVLGGNTEQDILDSIYPVFWRHHPEGWTVYQCCLQYSRIHKG